MNGINKYLCIHAHFYQPPRENPWLETVEIEDSAYPYHDWNERITAECYAPNTVSRILDERGRIVKLFSNYKKISFNIGPTLLSWLETNAHEVYKAIIEADKASIIEHHGHGNAIAQAYNHIIMPLATSQDKETQIIWGIEDFMYRFKHYPEGMWIPETAVDLETLDLMAAKGIKFTILAPHQAARIRKIGTEEWIDVSNHRIDTRRPYKCVLPSGRTITIFFYNGPVSRAVAFERVLERGEEFANRLMSGFLNEVSQPQLMSIATDGETYGHHHKFGDMALAYAIHYIESNNLAKLVNFGEYLEKHPPEEEVEIFENTSWSCAHGVERWRNNCGCNTGSNPSWNQEWRAPLREVLNWLRDVIAFNYDSEGSKYLIDPWLARNDYIHVILNRTHKHVDDFLHKHCKKKLTHNEKIRVLKLLEMERHSLLMFTSCGWFFDDISGIETIQIIKYAARAMQLLQDVTGNNMEDIFIEKISRARSNIQEIGDGAALYEKAIGPSIVTLEKVGIHYAVSSIFEEYPQRTKIYSYSVTRNDYHHRRAGGIQFALGAVHIRSHITMEEEDFNFSVIYFGNHNFYGGVKRYATEEEYKTMEEKFLESFEVGGFAEILALMDGYFGKKKYSFKDLFKDEQRKIINIIIDSSLREFSMSYQSMYEKYHLMMSFLKETGTPIPPPFYMAAEFTLNQRLKDAISEEEIDPHRIEEILEELKKWNAKLYTVELEYHIRHVLEGLMNRLKNNPASMNILNNVNNLVKILPIFPFDVNLWYVQNVYFQILKKEYPKFVKRASRGDGEAQKWIDLFHDTGDHLSFNIEAIMGQE